MATEGGYHHGAGPCPVFLPMSSVPRPGLADSKQVLTKSLANQVKRLPYLADVQVGLEAWAHLDHFLEVSLGAGQVVPVRHASEPHLGPLQVV